MGFGARHRRSPDFDQHSDFCILHVAPNPHRRLTNVTIANGIVRVDCVAAVPNNKPRPAGTLLIPGAAGPVLQALVNAMQELQRKPAEQVPTDRRQRIAPVARPIDTLAFVAGAGSADFEGCWGRQIR